MGLRRGDTQRLKKGIRTALGHRDDLRRVANMDPHLKLLEVFSGMSELSAQAARSNH